MVFNTVYLTHASRRHLHTTWKVIQKPVYGGIRAASVFKVNLRCKWDSVLKEI